MSSESREFQVFVKPVGARCNLRCSYCYYSGHSHPGRESGGQRMSDKVLERYIRQHIQAAGGGELFFSWHGGEPALAGIEFYRRAVALEKSMLRRSAGWLTASRPMQRCWMMNGADS